MCRRKALKILTGDTSIRADQPGQSPHMVLPILWFRTQPGVSLLLFFVEWSFVRMKARSDPRKLKAAKHGGRFFALVSIRLRHCFTEPPRNAVEPKGARASLPVSIGHD
jgi:hypothetical protein